MSADDTDERPGRAYDHRLVRRLLPYLRPYAGAIALAVLVTLAAAAVQLAYPWLTKEAIDVGIGVVPLPAGRPHGGDGAIPLLPGPEEVRGEPGPLRDHAHRVKDWVVTGLSHNVEYLDINRSCQGIQ